ncbi:MAG: hypothetical protein ACRDI1_03120 [Actinomycetota bacterium]
MRPTRLVPLLVTLLLVAAACGGGDDDGGGSGADQQVTIESPEDGAEVSAPFTLDLSAGVAIGPTDSGDHHFHVFYDGDEDSYEVVESETFEVTGLEPGEHTITVSLRNADHSAAGAEEEISVTVAGGAGGTGGEDDKDDPDY